MLKPNDLPLVCLPVDLSDEAAAKLVEFLHDLTDALERHYATARSLSATTTQPTSLSAISTSPIPRSNRRPHGSP